ncbi:OLC1v1023352C1 [Oldenlandia corymbosa var. corymbosa]|uniref:OLC1v1023352C1 n=1 Tax=Oldenlandia corymbosa var. corymbosa TaxID=529605 RepID=A0AAV1C1F3_OLDCO|nr:OLC1v1023352C1 [Oldenlandia corymbosa var. corymbosa]
MPYKKQPKLKNFSQSKFTKSKQIIMEVGNNPKNHFVLVHAAGHGAWSWYKLKPLLEAAGQRVTAIDMAAGGIDTKSLEELHTLHDHSLPLLKLMEAIPSDQKVVLVGHSYGGMNLALTMESYPEKIAVAVFVAAVLPDVVHAPSYPMEQFFGESPEDVLMDTKISTYGSPEQPGTSMLFGPKFLASQFYQNCSAEDIELAKLLIRPASTFMEYLSKAKLFSAEKYNSVKRAYVVCKEDKALTPKLQNWMIQNSGLVKVVKQIDGADHMPMLSTPQELCQCLLHIVDDLLI